MIDVRTFDTLGRMDADWLSARFHFSFAEYRDPERMAFGPLRVWNDDLFRPGGGFPMHPHRDMEIITYVRKGAVTHGDNLGNEHRVTAGDVQVMSAGSGIVHSEFNRDTEDLELFQIWIQPDRTGLPPRWETRSFSHAGRQGRFRVLASGRDGDDDGLRIHQDAVLLATDLAAGETVEHRLEPGRQAYLVPARGRIRINGVAVEARSGVAVTDEETITVEALEPAEVLLLDLP